MNILSKIYDERLIRKFKNYDTRTSSTTKHIPQYRIAIDKINRIKLYYSKDEISLLSFDDYIDYCFLIYLNQIENFSPRFKKQEINELMIFAEEKLKQIENSEVIEYINSEYKNIFKFKSEFRWISLDELLKYQNGIGKFDYIIKYLFKEEPIFIVDNIREVQKILSSDGCLIEHLAFHGDNFNRIRKFRFEKLLVIFEKFIKPKNRKYKSINNRLLDKLFLIAKDNNSDIFSRRIEIEKAIRYFKKINCSSFKHKIKKLKDIYTFLVEESEKELIESGKSKLISFDITDYHDRLKRLDTLSNRDIYLASTHNLQNRESILEEYLINYEVSTIDMFSGFNRNFYFTNGKVNKINEKLIEYSLIIKYFLSNSKKKNNYFEELNNSVDFITSELKISNSTIIKDTVSYMKFLVDSKLNDISPYIFILYLSTAIEELLREVYCNIHKDGDFLESSSLKIFLEPDINNPLEKFIGINQLRCFRYILLEDEYLVGVNLRNRLAHKTNIEHEDVSEDTVNQLLWIYTSIINSITINLMTGK